MPAVAPLWPAICLTFRSSKFARSNVLYLRMKVYCHYEMQFLLTYSVEASSLLFYQLPCSSLALFFFPVSLFSQSISQLTRVVFTVSTTTSSILEKEKIKRQERGEMMDFNNLLSLATGSCHPLIFALLCDSIAVVGGGVITGLNVQGKISILPWMDGSKWQWDPVITEGKHWIHELQGCWKLKESHHPPKTPQLVSGLA